MALRAGPGVPIPKTFRPDACSLHPSCLQAVSFRPAGRRDGSADLARSTAEGVGGFFVSRHDTWEPCLTKSSNSIPSTVVVLGAWFYIGERSIFRKKHVSFYRCDIHIYERWRCLRMAQGAYGCCQRGQNGKSWFQRSQKDDGCMKII